MPKVNRKDLKTDLVNLLIFFFGEKTGELVKEYYDEDHPEELIQAIEDMMAKLVGSMNAAKHLEPIYKKYSIKVKRDNP